MAGERIESETVAAYRAFCYYRDLPSDNRSTALAYIAFCANRKPKKGRKGGGNKKHAPGQWNRWHKKHDWKLRARRWDIEAADEALHEFFLAHTEELREFINVDFTLQKGSQKIAETLLTQMIKGQKLSVSPSAYRQTVMAYAETRKAIEDLIGIKNKHAEEQLERARADTD